MPLHGFGLLFFSGGLHTVQKTLIKLVRANDASNRSCGTSAIHEALTHPSQHAHVSQWVHPGILISILLVKSPCDFSELNGLNYGAHYLKVNVSPVMMEVFVFFPLCTTVCSGREKKDHSGLIKSLTDLVLACLAKSPSGYLSVPGAIGRRKHHKVPSKWSDSNCKCRDTWKIKEVI